MEQFTLFKTLANRDKIPRFCSYRLLVSLLNILYIRVKSDTLNNLKYCCFIFSKKRMEYF